MKKKELKRLLHDAEIALLYSWNCEAHWKATAKNAELERDVLKAKVARLEEWCKRNDRTNT